MADFKGIVLVTWHQDYGSGTIPGLSPKELRRKTRRNCRKSAKDTYATDYSYRTQRHHQQQLLSGWISALAPLLSAQGKVFSLDFHTIPFRGDPTALDNHFLPRRGKAGPSVLGFFAQEAESRVLCYANANLTRTDQPGELMRFVEFWHGLTGHDPQWLYFDSKVVPYPERVQSRLCQGFRRESSVFLPRKALSGND